MPSRLARTIIDRLILLLVGIPILACWWLVALGLAAAGEALAEQILGHPVVDPADEFHRFSLLLILLGPPIAMWFSLLRLNDALARRRVSSAARNASHRG